MTEHNIEVLARRRLHLLEQLEAVKAGIAAIDALIIDAVEVGGRVDVDDQPAFRVQQKRTFDTERARQVCPAELIAAATVPTLDTRALRSLLPPALVDACMKPGAVFVTAVKS